MGTRLPGFSARGAYPPVLNRAREGLGSQLVVAASWLVAGLSIVAVIAYTRLGLRFVAEGQEPLDAGGRDSGRL